MVCFRRSSIGISWIGDAFNIHCVKFFAHAQFLLLAQLDVLRPCGPRLSRCEGLAAAVACATHVTSAERMPFLPACG